MRPFEREKKKALLEATSEKICVIICKFYNDKRQLAPGNNQYTVNNSDVFKQCNRKSKL